MRFNARRDGAIPKRWFVCGIMESRDGTEYYFAVLRLPSWQLRPSIVTDRDEWHQLALTFHGRDGFAFRWFLAN